MSLKDRLDNPTKLTKPKTSSLKCQIEKEAKNPFSLGILDDLIKDDDISAIYVNGARNIFVEKKGKLHKISVVFEDETELQNLLKNYLLDSNSKKFNYKSGINALSVVPPSSAANFISIKCYRDKFSTLENLEENQVISKEIAIFLEALLKIKKNIIITGDKKALKTSLLSSIAKKIPLINRSYLFDFSKEIEINAPNFMVFDFSDKENFEQKTILQSILQSNPDNILMNDFDFEIDCVLENILNGDKGFIFNINAKSKEQAMDKITQKTLKLLPCLTYEKAKEITYRAFDFVIFVETVKSNGKKRVSSVAEISNNENTPFNDIFVLNNSNFHCSAGYIPEIFSDDDTVSINLNIFNTDYKHTYAIPHFDGLSSKEFNSNILKKFKKDKTDTNKQTNDTQTQDENQMQNKMSDDEFMKKAQEKFYEIKKNLIGQDEVQQ